MPEFAPTFDELNAKAEEAVRAHERAFGYKPSPGLLLNVLKAPIKPEEFPALFDAAAGGKRTQRLKQTNESVLGPNYQATDHPPGLAPPVEAPSVESVTGSIVQATEKLTSFFGGSVPKSRRDQAEEIARKWNEGDLSYGELWEMTRDDPSLQARVNRLISSSAHGSVDPPVPVSVPSLVPLADGTPNRDAAKEEEQYRAALDWSFQRYGNLTRQDLEAQGVYVSKGLLRGLEQGGDFIAGGLFGANRDNLLARTAYEIGLAGTQMPFGMYAIGLAVGRDAADLVTKGDLTPERTWELAKQSVVGTWNDLQNPLEHPGFFLLALSSVAGGAAGVGARIGNTAARVSAAQGVIGTGKALAGGVLFRPLPGQAVVAGEFVNLTENAAIRAIQRLYYQAADRAITRRTGPNGIPYGAGPVSSLVSSTPGVRTIDRARRRFFSFDQTYSRAVHRRMRAEIQDSVFQADRVQRMATGSAKASKTMDRLLENKDWSRWFFKQPAKTRLGVQKAMQVMAGDIDPDAGVAIRLEREYHERFLTDVKLAERTAERYGTDVPTIQRNHRAQILALNEAEKVVSSMDPRFVEAFHATKAMADLTEQMRKGLGLDEADAVDRIARYGAIIRGEPIREVPDPVGLIRAEIDKLNAAVAQRGGFTQSGKYRDTVARQERELAQMGDPEAQTSVGDVVERPRTRPEAERRVKEINRVYDDLVGKFYDLPPGWKQTLAKRNVLVGRLRREGKLSEQDIQARARARYGNLPKDDAIQAAEDAVAAQLRAATAGKAPDEWPAPVRRIIDLLDERDRLEAGLGQLDEITRGDDPFAASGRQPTEAEVGAALGTIREGGAVDKTLTALQKKRAKLEASIARNTEKDRLGSVAPEEISRGRLGENLKGETIRRVEQLQNAIDDPRLLTEPETVLKELGVAFDWEAVAHDPVSLDSFFFSAQRAGKGKVPSTFVGPGKQNPLGIAPPDVRRLIPELHHRFEGGSIEIGDYRVDVSALTSEGYKNTVRTTMTLTNWQRLWDLSTDKPGPHSFLIRNIDAGEIKPEIRALFKKLDEGTWDEASASYATDPNQVKILAALFPGRVLNGKLVDLDGNPLHLPDGSFRFVDERFVMDTPGQTSHLAAVDRLLSGEGTGLASQTIGTALQAYNEISRTMTLYLRTKYALNALSSAALLLIHEGFLAPVDLGRAVVGRYRYGPDVARWLDSLAGQSRTQSLISSKAPVTRASRTLADGWTVVTDQFFRRAAVIHELRKRGIRSPEQMREAMLSNDPTMLRTVREASARGKRGMVEFDNLNPFEQAIARHVLFIYPWVRGSAVWSMRFLVDHPIQAEVAYQIGSMKDDEFDNLLGAVPEMWKRMGMYLTGEDENGDLTASSTAWLAPTQAWHDLARPWVSLFQGDNPGRAALLESVGPQGTFLARVATARNQYGREYEGSPVKGAVMEQLGDTAIGALLNKRERLAKQAPLPELDPTSRKTLVTRESAAAKYPMTKLESNERIMDAFLNPFFEPTVDKEALNARAWMDVARSDRKAWHEHQMDLIRQGLELQAKVVGEAVPINVRTAAAFVDEWSWQNSEARRELGPGAVTDREKALRALPILVDLGVYTPEEAETRRAIIDDTSDGAEMKRYLATIQDEAGGRDLDEWNGRVRGIVQFRDTQTLNGINESLRKVGGGDYAGMLLSTEADRDEYGRQLDGYMEEYNRRVDEYEDVSLPQDEQDRLKREFRNWLVSTDEPVKIKGREFPSFERARWALLSDQQKQDELVDAAKRTPSVLSGFDRVLLGLPGNPKHYVQAWQAFEDQVDADLAAQADWLPAEKYTRRELEAWNADQWESVLPGFKAEWELASGPQVKWLERLPQFKASPNARRWAQMFQVADEWADIVVDTRRKLDAGEETDYLIGDVRKDWQTYVRDSLYGALPADFKAEVNDYGGLDWLASWMG